VIGLVYLYRPLSSDPPIADPRTSRCESAETCAPCGFVGDACLALDLLCGDTAARGTHLVHFVKPHTKRGSAFLENGSSKRVDVMPAVIARVSGPACHAGVLALFALALLAMALSDSTREALLFQELKAGIIVGELAVKVVNRVPQVLWNRLLSSDLY